MNNLAMAVINDGESFHTRRAVATGGDCAAYRAAIHNIVARQSRKELVQFRVQYSAEEIQEACDQVSEYMLRIMEESKSIGV